VAVVDTTTFTAGLPPTHAAWDIRPWLVLGAAALVALLAALAVTATRRRLRGRPATA